MPQHFANLAKGTTTGLKNNIGCDGGAPGCFGPSTSLVVAADFSEGHVFAKTDEAMVKAGERRCCDRAIGYDHARRPLWHL
jgi:hypothetical protein